jgi:uncharacterized protein with PIN domain
MEKARQECVSVVNIVLLGATLITCHMHIVQINRCPICNTPVKKEKKEIQKGVFVQVGVVQTFVSPGAIG